AEEIQCCCHHRITQDFMLPVLAAVYSDDVLIAVFQYGSEWFKSVLDPYRLGPTIDRRGGEPGIRADEHVLHKRAPRVLARCRDSHQPLSQARMVPSFCRARG